MQIKTEAPIDQSYLERFPVVSRFLAVLDQAGSRMDMRTCEGGAEMQFRNEVNGMPNRACLRIYFPMESKCVLFFHKKSSIPFSRDRFSYGGVVIDARSTQRFTDEDVREWTGFLLSGLSPASRPKTLKKSFPYTIPED